MQTITKILKIDGSEGVWTSEYGKSAATPVVVVGVRAKLRFDLRSTLVSDKTGKLLAIDPENVTSGAYYIALDSDVLQETDPKLLKVTGISLVQATVDDLDSDGSAITEQRVFLDAEIPNTAVPGLLEALNGGQTSVTLKGEIGGCSDGRSISEADFAFSFALTIKNRVYLGGEVPEEVQNDPEYLTAVQVQAMIAAATQAPAASLEIGTVSSGTTAAASVTGTPPNQTLNLTLPKGSDGITPSIGENGNWFIGTSDTGIAATGENGVTPSIGENGNWYIGPTDTGVKAAGINGKDGTGIEYDKSGLVSEKPVYDDEPAGFRFAATVTDSEAKTCTLYIWKKLSDEHADWSDPLAFTIFEREKETAILKPKEFIAPTSTTKCLSFDLSAYPAATVASVCIDTDAGELTLPYKNVEGITKIIKTTAGIVNIYFGALVPTYSTGRIYFSQMVGLTTAAVDPDVPDPVTGAMYYGYISSAVAGAITSVTQITSEILAAAVTAGTMTETTPATLDKTSLGTVPAGSWPVVLIPSAAAYVATKDNGIGGKVSFALNNGVDGSGANGTAVTIGSKEYKVYGEFQLVTAEQSIYIDEEE